MGILPSLHLDELLGYGGKSYPPPALSAAQSIQLVSSSNLPNDWSTLYRLQYLVCDHFYVFQSKLAGCLRVWFLGILSPPVRLTEGPCASLNQEDSIPECRDIGFLSCALFLIQFLDILPQGLQLGFLSSCTKYDKMVILVWIKNIKYKKMENYREKCYIFKRFSYLSLALNNILMIGPFFTSVLLSLKFKS